MASLKISIVYPINKTAENIYNKFYSINIYI